MNRPKSEVGIAGILLFLPKAQKRVDADELIIFLRGKSHWPLRQKNPTA